MKYHLPSKAATPTQVIQPHEYNGPECVKRPTVCSNLWTGTILVSVPVNDRQCIVAYLFVNAAQINTYRPKKYKELY